MARTMRIRDIQIVPGVKSFDKKEIKAAVLLTT